MWVHFLAQPDSLTLPGYGLAGAVIAMLSTACLKLYNRNTQLTDEAIKRERQTADETIPLLVKAIDVLSTAAPHINPTPTATQTAAELEAVARRTADLLSRLEQRETGR